MNINPGVTPSVIIVFYLFRKTGLVIFGLALSILVFGKYDGKIFTNYTMKDGLTSNSIICIYKDNKRVLWLGTSGGGLCKFNGERFEKFVLE